MVDDEVDRHQRVDALRVAAERLHRVAHRGEVDHRRHAGEVLHQHARRAEGDLAVAPVRVFSQSAMPRMSSAVTERPSSKRSRFSSSTFSEKGRREMPGKAVLLGLGEAVIVVALVADGEGTCGS